MSDEMSRYDPLLGYVPAIPEPFWEKPHWWNPWRPMCVECSTRFLTKSEYETHYALTHIDPLTRQENMG